MQHAHFFMKYEQWISFLLQVLTEILVSSHKVRSETGITCRLQSEYNLNGGRHSVIRIHDKNNFTQLYSSFYLRKNYCQKVSKNSLQPISSLRMLLWVFIFHLVKFVSSWQAAYCFITSVIFCSCHCGEICRKTESEKQTIRRLAFAFNSFDNLWKIVWLASNGFFFKCNMIHSQISSHWRKILTEVLMRRLNGLANFYPGELTIITDDKFFNGRTWECWPNYFVVCLFVLFLFVFFSSCNPFPSW